MWIHHVFCWPLPSFPFANQMSRLKNGQIYFTLPKDRDAPDHPLKHSALWKSLREAMVFQIAPEIYQIAVGRLLSSSNKVISQLLLIYIRILEKSHSQIKSKTIPKKRSSVEHRC